MLTLCSSWYSTAGTLRNWLKQSRRGMCHLTHVVDLLFMIITHIFKCHLVLFQVKNTINYLYKYEWYDQFFFFKTFKLKAWANLGQYLLKVYYCVLSSFTLVLYFFISLKNNQHLSRKKHKKSEINKIYHYTTAENGPLLTVIAHHDRWKSMGFASTDCTIVCTLRAGVWLPLATIIDQLLGGSAREARWRRLQLPLDSAGRHPATVSVSRSD